MPSWKKVILSGSDAALNTLTVTNGITGSLFGTASYANNATTATTASHALTASYIDSLYQDVELHGNLTVYGTSSFNYVTSSELQVQDSFISVNVFEPAERFGGIKVYDSGSSTATASLAWDSLHNHWVYENIDGSNYSGAMFMSGPRNTGSLGDEPTLTRWRVARSDGGDHLDDTQIYSSGSITQITGSLTVTNGITGSLLGNAATATIAANGGVTSIIAGSGVTLPFGGTGDVTVVALGGTPTIISGSSVTSSFSNSNSWVFNHNLGTRTPVITVFDSDYNQILPQNIQLNTDSSATITFPTNESGFAIASTGGTTGTSYTSSYSTFAVYASSASYFPETDPIFVAKSGSLATTGSNTFIGTQNVTGDILVTGNIIPTISSSYSLGSAANPWKEIYLQSGSISMRGLSGAPDTTLSNVNGNIQISAGGMQLLGSGSFNAATGSFGYISGSMTQVGNYNQTGNYTVVGNKTITGSLSVKGNIVFGSGSTTPTGSLGALEYDGTTFYGTPSTGQRGVVCTPQVYYNRASASLANDASQQSFLGLTNGVAVTGGMRYSYVIKSVIYASANNVSIFYANGGTATYSNTHYWADVGKAAFLGSFAPMTRTRTELTTDGSIRDPKHISYGLTGECYWEIVLHGILDVATSGYMKPIIQFSPIPGANSKCLNGSYMEIYPIGPSGAQNTVIGNWS